MLVTLACAATLSAGAAQLTQTRPGATGPARPEVLIPLSGTWTADYEDARQILTVQGAGERKAPDAEAAATLFGAAGGATMVKSLADPGAFTIAVARSVKDFRDGQISVRFKLVAGATDQTAGIVFNLKPDGSYTYARYNTKDGNVAIWKFENGARTVLTHGEAHEQLPLNTWQTLTVSVKGPDVAASAHGGKLTVKHTLPAPVSGRVGVWTKNDSVTSFRDYMVTDKQFEKAGLSQKAEVRSQK
jgi:hypothetical protein